MTFYSRARKRVDEILGKRGLPVTIVHTVQGTYVPGTGITNTTTTQYGTGAIFEYDAKQAGIYNTPGSLIKMGDKQLLLSALNTGGSALTAPVRDDTVTVDGTTYTITHVKKVDPGGTAVLYDINIRE